MITKVEHKWARILNTNSLCQNSNPFSYFCLSCSQEIFLAFPWCTLTTLVHYYLGIKVRQYKAPQEYSRVTKYQLFLSMGSLELLLERGNILTVHMCTLAREKSNQSQNLQLLVSIVLDQRTGYFLVSYRNELLCVVPRKLVPGVAGKHMTKSRFRWSQQIRCPSDAQTNQYWAVRRWSTDDL